MLSKKALLASVSIGAMLFAGPAQAQTSTSSDQLETVVVTGTLIRGVETPTGSNLLNIGTEQIQASGVTTAVDLLNQTVPQLPTFNALATGSASYGSPVKKIGLRGFGNSTGNASGATATLILFNGHRVVPMGILSTEPDPDLIPADIIESVQVMPDGGSATYGSDAVGGVVNFVTRTNFDGVQLHAQNSFADSYNDFNVSLSAGTSWTGGSALISIMHDNHDAVLGKDRDFDTTNFTAHGGGDYRATACDYGTFAVGGTTYIAPNFTAISTAPKCDATDNSSLYPAETRSSVFAYAEQQLTPSLKFSMDGYWSKRDTKVYIDTAAIPTSMAIDNTNPYWHPIGSETSQTVSFNYARALGPYRITPQTFTQYQVTPTLTWDVDGNWQARASLSYGESNATIHDRSGINGSAVSATTLDPYDTSVTSKIVLADLANYEVYSEGINTLASAQIVADGKVFSLPGGDVHVAVGGEIRRQTLRDTTSTGPIGAHINEGVFPAGRTIKAGFAELLVPIVGDQNALPFVKKLSLDAAVRYDDYSDFGGTTNPRIGIDYKPVDDLLIRANFQTTFDAPSLADSGDKVDTRFQILTIAPNNYLVFIAGAGTDVKPMTGTTFSVGGEWTPHAVDGLKFGATYWNTTLKNLVSLSLGAYGLTGALNTPYNLCGSGYGPFVAAAAGPCTAAYINSIQDTWVRIDNGSAPAINSISDLFKPGVNVISVLDARRANFGMEKMSGIDFDTSYTTDVSFGTLFGQFAGTYILTKKIAPSASAAYVDYLNGAAVNGSTSQYNLVGSIGAIVGPYMARISVNHNAGYNIPAGTSVGQTKVGSFTVAKLYLSADLGQLAVMKENELTLTIDNLFDQDPPYYGTNPTIGSNGTTGGFANGGTLGRMFTVSLRTKF